MVRLPGEETENDCLATARPLISASRTVLRCVLPLTVTANTMMNKKEYYIVKIIKKLSAILALSGLCISLFSGCFWIAPVKQLREEIQKVETGEDEVRKPTTPEVTDRKDADSIITSYNWMGDEGDSLLACETDGTFKYYRDAYDLSDNYYDGTYVFTRGFEAFTYLTEDLEEYGITSEEMLDYLLRNAGTEYSMSNLVCLVLNNERCIMDGEDQLDSPHKTPYYGFVIEKDGEIYLDLANMNTANYWMYIAVEK